MQPTASTVRLVSFPMTHRLSLYLPLTFPPARVRPQRRHLSGQQQPARPQGFIGKLIDNIKQEYEKNKEMKESLEKFKREAEKLEQSEALKKAR